ncbi:EpsG family protein [Luteimonas sp. FCS-9]|uniref:EpsG family protein n=1 Tax=Luteimonas sp. FCS-9 TaxID=1547516 RepID=UPI00063EB0C8|nr:EpsG family protein [Luteimonas sp. FCS-9]KLJ00735.1 hypothetical protein WQ56_08030 [Luteimonas sp. FCS-9]
MTGFWLMFLLPVWALLAPPLPDEERWVPWAAIGVLFALMIGLRYEVGGDWGSYLQHFHMADALPFTQAVRLGDPGHFLVNWVVGRLGGDIYWVNLLYGSLMMWGTVVFCRRQPWPWLALLVAVPYMLIVVGMGYSRQAVALGFALLGLSALGDQRVRTFVVCIAMGALFHKSAVLLLPVAALAASRNRTLTVGLVGLTGALLYYLLLADSTETLWENYVEAQYHSEGGLIRVAMNVVPAVLFLVFRDRLAGDAERRLWVCISLFAIACLPLVPLASTAVDRVALYLIPLQLFVFARLPLLAGGDVRVRTLLVAGTVAYYAVVQYVWLHFATHAEYWVPYRFLPFE